MIARRCPSALAFAFALAVGLVVCGSRGAAAQASIRAFVAALPGAADSISPAPAMSLTATPVPIEFQPSTIQLEIALDATFRTPVFARATQSLSADFVVDSLLPERRRAFFRARLFDRFGTVRAETTFSRPVVTWLSLVTANRRTNVLFSRTPRLEWNSPALTLPPGPWGEYTVTIFNTAKNTIEQQKHVSSTFYVPDPPLEACTSYRWSVGARAQNSVAVDSVVVNSVGTFVIQTADCPTATIFYNPFPNPFGRGTPANDACFWFDLAHRATVRLTLYDARLRQVRRLVPGGNLGAVLDSGAYGRPATTDVGSCDTQLQWDGTDQTGRQVPPGLYFAVFEAEGIRVTHKIVFKGR